MEFLLFAFIGWVIWLLLKSKMTAKATQMEQNASNGSEIRTMALEMGIPEKEYNNIVINQMDKAKEMAMQLDEPGMPYHNKPWNIRLAVAINDLYQAQAAHGTPLAQELNRAVITTFQKMRNNDWGPHIYDLPAHECWQFALRNGGRDFYTAPDGEERSVAYRIGFQDQDQVMILEAELANYASTGVITDEGDLETRLLPPHKISIRVSII